MYGELIYISSLKHEDIVNEFNIVHSKRKYACFYSADIKKALRAGANASDHYLLAMPFNKKIHWFLARETSHNGDTITLEIVDRHVIKGAPPTQVIDLPVNEKGLLDNTGYSFYGDVNRDDSDLKIIQAVRKNSMGDYDFNFSHDNAFKIIPRTSDARF